MLTNEYLYGKDVEVPEIPMHIIVRRIEALEDNLGVVMEVPYLTRDTKRQNDILKAIKWWRDIHEQ